jgi:3-oxoacyl-[acyl-carrier-protein] synthase-1
MSAARATPRVVITGSGAICGAGRTPQEIFDAVLAGRSALRPIEQWNASRWPVNLAAEVPDYNAAQLTGDRKLLKFIRRSDVFGLYAADRAIDDAGFTAWRATLDEAAATRFADGTGVFVGSGGGNFSNQYDYFPLIAAAHGELGAFGRELSATVNPMWLLRSLPNNVLGHVGIRHGLKGPNACITHHSVSGLLALAEAADALRAGECERAVAAAHDAPVEPQSVLYYHQAGLLSATGLSPFDAAHDGSAMGEGGAALVVETEAAAQARGARVLGEVLGSATANDALGLLPVDANGDGLARAIGGALDASGLAPRDIGMVVAHGNGTPNSDASEARALVDVFGDALPPVTAFKWAFGHLLAASGLIDVVVALQALHARSVPGLPGLREVDPACAALPLAPRAQPARGDTALVLSRGFGGTNVACVVRAP